MTYSVLYLGDDQVGCNSSLRADALRRLGCQVTTLNPLSLVGGGRWQSFLGYRTGYRFLQRRLLWALKAKISDNMQNPYTLVWVNGGELLGTSVLKWLHLSLNSRIILYQNDDPTGHRDGNRFLSLQAAIPFYDLCVLLRSETALEVLAMGARRVLRVFSAFDEVFQTLAYLAPQQTADPFVFFIGTLIPGEQRDGFLLALLNAGLPMRLIGNNWHRSRQWPLLVRIYQGPGITGVAYAKTIESAAVSLGLLSHLNRDLITQRSVETPAYGGLLCAERTSEHQLLYEDGHEAVFWSSPDECIEQCRQLLEDFPQNQAIRGAGLQQVHRLGVGNEDICRQILAAL